MQHSADLPRRLGLLDAVSIVVGVVIGAGIFLTPNEAAKALHTPGAILAAWIFAGLLSLCGALALAELGAMIPATGGAYVFLREAYGPGTAFLCGWSSFFVCHSAAIAWLGVSFSRYLGHFVNLSPMAAKAVGVGLLAVLASVNYRGVILGAAVQKSFAAIKVIGLIVLIGSAAFAPRAQNAPSGEPFEWSGFGVALIACLLCYDGWTTVSSVAGEIRDPKRNVLRALTIGVSIVIVAYVTANWAYLRVLTLPELAASERVAADAGVRTMGSFGGALVSVTILLSIVGSLNGWLLTQPRLYFAQARDGLFFRRFTEVHSRFHTPSFSILMLFAWSAVLVLTGSFQVLISYAMFSIWTFYVFTVVGVIVLRVRQPKRERPYRMWGYPVTPALFALVAIWFLVNTAIERPGPSLTALGIILAGIPAYWFWRKSSASDRVPDVLHQEH